MIAYVIKDADTGRRLAAAWDALSADEKASALDAGHRLRIDAVEVSERSLAAARRPKPLRPPVGYRLRKPASLVRSTLRRPWTVWAGALAEIAQAGDWTTWGHGHVDAPITMALEARGVLAVAVPIRGRGRLLFKPTADGYAGLRRLGYLP